MDLSFIEQVIPNIAAWLNLDPATVLLIFVTISSVSNVIARAIPDDQTGFLGGLRNVCKVLGLYVSNRVTEGVKTSEVVAEVAKEQESQTVQQELDEWMSRDAAPVPVTPAFPGFKREQANEEDDSIGYTDLDGRQP